MRYYKSLFFIILFLFIIQPVRTKKSPPILSWDDPRLGREGALPKPTEEEVYSAYVKSEFGLTSTEAGALGIQMSEEVDMETSQYLIGDVAVGLIFVQCTHELNPSCNEEWTTPMIDEVVNGIGGIEGIEDGLEWLKDEEPRAGATFYHFIEEVSIPVKPTDYIRDYDRDWIFPTMEAMGYDGSLIGMYDYLDYLRTRYGTDWAFMIFIVLGDHFPPNDIAWARIHGPYAVMTYELNGFKYLRSHITAHETAHIFGAQDEYYSPSSGGCFCSVSGNLMVPNLMCERGCFQGFESNCVECVWGGVCSNDVDCPEGEVCDVDNRCTCTDDSDCGGDEFCGGGKCKHRDLMKGPNHWNICPFIRAQIGWRDCDGDNVLDPIDTDGICGDPVDSDGTGPGSKNYIDQGTCSGGCDYTTWSCDGGKTDYCIDDYNDYALAEYYVSDNSDFCIPKRKDCTDIDPGYSCLNGRCTSCIGDLNDDGEINLPDLIIVANAYGSYPGHPDWDSDADLNDDGEVGLLDLAIVATHYGEFCT